MGKKLLQLIEQVTGREDVGTLFLGKGDRIRHIFFSGDEVHLLDAGREGQFVPCPQLLGPRATADGLNDLVQRRGAQNGSYCAPLVESGFMPEEKMAELLELEMLEEMLHLIDRCNEHFLFEEGNVPESLLFVSPDDGHTAISVEKLKHAIKIREQERKEIAEILPRLDEKPVLSERGHGVLDGDRHWTYAFLARSIDGFRTVQNAVEESPFSPHRTLSILCAGARQGWIRKTQFKELEGVELTGLDSMAARSLARRYELAADMAVDDLPIRERLIELQKHCGLESQAVLQLNLLGDSYHNRGEISRALELYEEGLDIDPANDLLKNKVYSIQIGRADDASNDGRFDEARALVEQCLRLRPTEFDLYLKYLDTFGQDESVVSRETLRQVETLRRGENELARLLLETMLGRFPESLPLRRRQVNFLLDDGNTEAAIAELEELGAQLKKQGETAEAQEIQKKIERLTPDPEEDESDGVAQTRTKRRRPSLVVILLCGAILVFGAYQQKTYQQLDSYRDQFAALAAANIPAPGTRGFRQEQKRTERFVESLREFLDDHPAMIWGPSVQTAILAAEDRMFYLDHSSRREFDRLLETAIRHETKGEFDEAREWYLLLEKRGAETTWSEQARARLDRLDNYRQRARDLLAAGQRAESEEDYEGAFEIYRELVLDFSRTGESRQVLLPIRVECPDRKVTVHAEGKDYGPAPAIVPVHPFDPLEIQLLDESGHVTVIVVEGPLEHTLEVELD